MKEKLGWFVHPAFSTWAPPFEAKYQMVDFFKTGDPAFSKYKTKKQDGRHCIFCNRSYPEATFGNAAHLISKMIGNKDLYSTFECDDCNNRFSLFETDLSYFLGIGRSFSAMHENKKIPGFAGGNLDAKSIVFNGKKILIIKTQNAEHSYSDGVAKLMYQKPTYTPANVYKLFLKCAISVLPMEVINSDYQLALSYIRGEKVLSGAHVNIFRFPLSVKMPLHIQIFHKKVKSEPIPTYIASFYFDNLVVTFPVLLHRNDLQYMNKKINLLIAPPYLVYGNDISKLAPSVSMQNLSSPIKLKYEIDELNIEFEKSQLEKAALYDPVNGTESVESFNPADSKYQIITEENVAFTKEELAELHKRIELEFMKK